MKSVRDPNVKLLYVIHQFFPDCFSGTEQYCLAAAREARRRGDEVVVMSLVPNYGRDDPPLLVTEDDYDGFRVIRLRHWWGLQPNEVLRDYENPLIAARFAQVLATESPRAVHFFHLRNLGSDLIEAARNAGIRTVVNLMDYWYLCPRFTLLRSDDTLCEGPPDGGLGCIPCQYPRLEAWAKAELHSAVSTLAGASSQVQPGSTHAAQVDALLRRKDVQLRRLAHADTVIAPSQFLADMFTHNGFPADRMQVVPYGLEPGRVHRADVQRPRHPLRLGFAGVLSPWKAPHLAIDAVRQLKDPIRLSIHGRTEEPMFADYIRGLRERAASDDRITFAGAFDRAGLDHVMADLDMLVVPSTWYENTPFVILEALEAGVPVIASDLGGMAEVIVDGDNGYLFESGNAASLAEILHRCATDPTAVAALSPEPPDNIASNYNHFLVAYGH